MPPIEELLKHLRSPKYRHILNDDGRPVSPKALVYTEISELLQGAMSPKYIYTVILVNRYGVHDELLQYHNLQRPINIITSSSIDDDESFNRTNKETDIKFLIKIPLKIWHDIDCEKIIYKSTSKVQRNYSTLRRGRWTNAVFDLVSKEIKLPCPFMFKRCTISESGIYLTVYASCPHCKCTLTGITANKPSKNADVRMECCVAGFDPAIEHVKKRPLNGEKRIEVTESLATASATIWRRNFARDHMDMYDGEPPNLHRAATLRKEKQERRDKFLKVKGTCANSSLNNMKYTDYAGSIHAIGHDPFFVHHWTTTQIAVYIDHHDVVDIDATGSLIKKFLLPNGEQCPHIYLYQALVDTGTYKMPVFQMLSAAQNLNAIQYCLCEFLRIGERHKSGFPLPRTVVCDFDKALLDAIAKAFGQNANLKAYLSTCYALLLKEA